MEKGHYNSWAELFKIHCRVYQVIDHILPPPAPSFSGAPKDKEKDAPPTPPAVDQATRSRMDAFVL